MRYVQCHNFVISTPCDCSNSFLVLLLMEFKKQNLFCRFIIMAFFVKKYYHLALHTNDCRARGHRLKLTLFTHANQQYTHIGKKCNVNKTARYKRILL